MAARFVAWDLANRMVVIDLNAPAINSDRVAWRIFSDAGYRFLGEFKDQSTVFLDFPDLTLPQGEIADSEELLPRILSSTELHGRVKQDEGIPELRSWQNFSRASSHPSAG